MASTTDELFSAIEAGDVDRIRALVAADPALAGARDVEGVSALMRARYRSDRGATQALLEAGPDLDVFEAAAFGDLDRLTALLGERPHGNYDAGVVAMTDDKHLGRGRTRRRRPQASVAPARSADHRGREQASRDRKAQADTSHRDPLCGCARDVEHFAIALRCFRVMRPMKPDGRRDE